MAERQAHDLRAGDRRLRRRGDDRQDLGRRAGQADRRRRDRADRHRGLSIPGVLVTRPIMADDAGRAGGRCPRVPPRRPLSTIVVALNAQLLRRVDLGRLRRARRGLDRSLQSRCGDAQRIPRCRFAPGEPVVQNV